MTNFKRGADLVAILLQGSLLEPLGELRTDAGRSKLNPAAPAALKTREVRDFYEELPQFETLEHSVPPSVCGRITKSETRTSCCSEWCGFWVKMIPGAGSCFARNSESTRLHPLDRGCPRCWVPRAPPFGFQIGSLSQSEGDHLSASPN